MEIKAKARSWNQQLAQAAKLSSSRELLSQEDVFFLVTRGRLKLRKFNNGEAQLIFYQRSNQKDPKLSGYEIVPVDNPSGMENLLDKSLGKQQVIRKDGTVFMCGQTRIHFDEVEDLGEFIELEVVMKPDQSEEEAKTIAQKIMEKLGIQSEDLIENSYADMVKP